MKTLVEFRYFSGFYYRWTSCQIRISILLSAILYSTLLVMFISSFMLIVVWPIRFKLFIRLDIQTFDFLRCSHNELFVGWNLEIWYPYFQGRSWDFGCPWRKIKKVPLYYVNEKPKNGSLSINKKKIQPGEGGGT